MNSFEIVIIGAGPAGIAAACVAAESGQRVAVLDDTPWVGGQIWRGEQQRPSSVQARKWIERFRRSGATLLDRTSAIAAPRGGVILAERGNTSLEILWQKLILATGARELFLPFPGWTLPNVMGPGGLQSLVKNGWPIKGKRAVIVGSGPLLLAVADGLKKHGAQVISVNEQAPLSKVAKFGFTLMGHPGKLCQGIKIKTGLLGVPYRCGVWPTRAQGDSAVQSVTLTNGSRTWTEDCDVLACGFGLVPNVELALALGCDLAGGSVKTDRWQATSVPGVFCAGEPTGIGGADCALTEGRIAGLAASGKRSDAEALFARRSTWHHFRASLGNAFALRDELRTLADDDTLICRCEDVSLRQVKRFSGWTGAKLQTRCGMGPCQGRICGAATKFVFGWENKSVRPPVLPVRVRSLVTGDSTSRPDATTLQSRSPNT